jgi:5'-nucleotidase
MESIQYVGFDMDYTLAVYKSPAYEELSYKLAVQRLMDKGYPKEIEKFTYDPSFPIRGLFLDTRQGYFLKVDAFGYILNCVKGRKVITNVREVYPTRIVHPEEIGDRFYLFDTLFGLAEQCLYADLVEYFEGEGIKVEASKNNQYGAISYRSLFEDVRSAIHTAHMDGTIKKITIENLDKYVEKNEGLPLLLHRLRHQNRKTFLLTNSEYYYTNVCDT